MIDYSKIKKHYIMILAIMFVVVSLSGTTYSLFINVDTTNEFTYNTGILDLQFIEFVVVDIFVYFICWLVDIAIRNTKRA